MTIQNQIIKMLESKGYVSVPTRTNKYVAMYKRGMGKRTNKEIDVYYFVGKRGSVKLNNKNAIDGSRNCTDSFKIRLENYNNEVKNESK